MDVCIGNWLFLWIRSYKSSAPPTQPYALSGVGPHPQPLPPPDDEWDAELSKLDLRRSSTPVPYGDDLPDIETITHTPTKPVAEETSRPLGLKCTARTRTGSKCRLPATPGGMRCRRHL